MRKNSASFVCRCFSQLSRGTPRKWDHLFQGTSLWVQNYTRRAWERVKKAIVPKNDTSITECAFDKSQHADGHERACDKFRRHPCRKPMDFLTQPMDFLTQINTMFEGVCVLFGGGKNQTLRHQNDSTHNWRTAKSHTNYAWRRLKCLFTNVDMTHKMNDHVIHKWEN